MTDRAASHVFTAARQAARARADVLGLPTQAQEDWRYVNVAPMATPPAPTRMDPVSTQTIAPFMLADCALTLVVVDGVPRSDLMPAAILANLNNGILDALEVDEARRLTDRWLAHIAQTTDISACWTLAEGADGDATSGIRLHARGAVVGCVHLLMLSTGQQHGARVVIELTAGSMLDVVISHVALQPTRSSIGVEVALAQGAALRVDELQYGPAVGHSQIFRHSWMRNERDATLTWTTLGIGAELARFRSESVLAGTNAHIQVNGLSMLAGTHQCHHLVRVEHQATMTNSAQLFKTSADDASLASFDGLVRIDRGADGANAEQKNHNLLLSPKAKVETRPQLDICADDVKAAHGATVGRPNPDELFYLQSRGLSAADALAVLTRGFADDLRLRLFHPAARACAEHHILNRGR